MQISYTIVQAKTKLLISHRIILVSPFFKHLQYILLGLYGTAVDQYLLKETFSCYQGFTIENDTFLPVVLSITIYCIHFSTWYRQYRHYTSPHL